MYSGWTSCFSDMGRGTLWVMKALRDRTRFSFCLLFSLPLLYSLSGPTTCIQSIQYPETSSHSGSPQQLGPLGHSLCFLLILEIYMEADIPAWGISFKEVLISPHAKWKQRIEREKKVHCRGGRAGEQGNQGKLFVGLGVFRLVFPSF